jgi:hypothetical protein
MGGSFSIAACATRGVTPAFERCVPKALRSTWTPTARPRSSRFGITGELEVAVLPVRASNLVP